MPFDEAKFPQTLANIHAWAREKSPDALNSLPSLNRLTFVDIDTLKFSRVIRHSLSRCTHKQLLIVGAYAPGQAIEDAEVGAHIHADEGTVSFFRIEELKSVDYEVQSVKSTGAIAFHAPFSNVSHDGEDKKAVNRMEALISWYFLAAGHLEELIRHQKYPYLFTKGFEHACRWIENGGVRPNASPSSTISTMTSVRQGIIEAPVSEMVTVQGKYNARYGAYEQ